MEEFKLLTDNNNWVRKRGMSARGLREGSKRPDKIEVKINDIYDKQDLIFLIEYMNNLLMAMD